MRDPGPSLTPRTTLALTCRRRRKPTDTRGEETQNLAYQRSATNESLTGAAWRWIRPCTAPICLRLANISPVVLTGALTRFAFVGAFVHGSLQGLTALVVDDDADLRKSIARILRLAGAEVSVTSTVEGALQRLEANSGMSSSGISACCPQRLRPDSPSASARPLRSDDAVTDLTRRNIDARSSCMGSPTVSPSHLMPNTSWKG